MHAHVCIISKGYVMAYVGPQDLALQAILQRKLHNTGSEVIVPSDKALVRLVELAYAASLLKEEGTSVRCQLTCPGQQRNGELERCTIRFAEPISLDRPEVLAKMSSACPLEGRAFVVEELDNAFQIVGVLLLRRGLDAAPLGEPHLNLGFQILGSTVAILGPGNIKLYGAHLPLELSGGKILSSIVRSADYPTVWQLFERIAKNVFGNHIQFTNDTPPDDGDSLVQYYLGTVWQSIIDQMCAKKHGGALVIATEPSLSEIDIKFELSGFSFGDKMLDLWRARFSQKDEKVSLDRVSQWRDSHALLRHAIRAIVDFSTVDGVIVVDHTLNVRGFGCKLSANMSPTGVQYLNVFTGDDDDTLPERVRHFGTRHQSAFRFCAAHPETAAFVVSQDGQLRLFAHIGNDVMMVDTASPQPQTWSDTPKQRRGHSSIPPTSA